MTLLKTWTEKEVEILKANYNTATNKELSALLPGKTPLAIYKKGYKLGFRKTAEIEHKNRSDANKGEKSGNWKGGVKMTTCGYRQILQPDHPRADVHGYVLEHIAVWEAATGISIPPNCCIHHLNGDKTDNRIQNLCLMQRTAHIAFHHTGAKRSAETRRKISEARRRVLHG